MSITATQDYAWTILPPDALGRITASRSIEWAVQEFHSGISGTVSIRWAIGVTDETIELELTGAPTGLTGTITIELVGADGVTVAYPETSDGITEIPAGTGRYVAVVPLPAAGDYFVIWSDGSETVQTTLAIREIRVTTLQTPIKATSFSEYSIKASDTEPGLLVTLRNAGGLPVDLSNAIAVTATVLRKGDLFPIFMGRTMTIIDPPTAGQVLLEWQQGDTDSSGIYSAEFAIAWPDDGRTTTPTKATYRFVIEAAGV